MGLAAPLVAHSVAGMPGCWHDLKSYTETVKHHNALMKWCKMKGANMPCAPGAAENATVAAHGKKCMQWEAEKGMWEVSGCGFEGGNCFTWHAYECPT